MSVAWTTIVVIALLLPGVFFFIGYSSRERYTREIVKSSAVGEIGWAVFVAITIHLLAWGGLTLGGFDLAANLKRLADFDVVPRWQIIDYIVRWIAPLGCYVLGTALAGFLAGYGLSHAIGRGALAFLATHKSINDVMRSMQKGLVTAYVMTTTKENNRVLMYKGVLAEFYLSPEGKFIYVVLRTCSRFYMKFADDAPTTSEQLQLFGPQEGDRPERSWDYLLIDGANIANILFDPSPQIVASDKGEELLNQELDALMKQLGFSTEEAADLEFPGSKRPSPQSN